MYTKEICISYINLISKELKNPYTFSIQYKYFIF